MPRKRKKFVHQLQQEQINIFEYVQNDILGQISLFLDYQDIYSLTRVSKFFNNCFRKNANSLFSQTKFIRSLVQRDINRYFGSQNFEILYAAQENEAIRKINLNDKFYKIIHIINEEKFDFYENALQELKPNLCFHEAKYLFTQLIRIALNKSTKFHDRKVTLMCLGYAAFFYLKEPNLQNILTLSYFMLTANRFAEEILYDFLCFLFDEKTKPNKDINAESIINKINELLDIKNIKAKVYQVIASNSRFDQVVSKIKDEFTSFFPDTAQYFTNLTWQMQRQFLAIFSHFKGSKLLEKLIEHSLLPQVFALENPTFLILFLSNKRHWVFDMYKQKTLNQIVELENYVGTSSLQITGISSESLFAYLDEIKFKEFVSNNNYSLRQAYVEYFSDTYKDLLALKQGSVKKNSDRLAIIRQLIIIALLKHDKHLFKLVNFFDFKEALRIAKNYSSKIIDGLIDKFEKHDKLKNIPITVPSRSLVDIFKFFENISDDAIQSILKYIDKITLKEWHKLKYYTKYFIFELHIIASKSDDENYVQKIFSKFPLSTIESIKDHSQLISIIHYFSGTPLFEKLSAEQLKTAGEKVLQRIIEVSNLEFQALLIDTLLKKYQGKKFSPKEKDVLEIINELQKETSMQVQKQNSNSFQSPSVNTDRGISLATNGVFGISSLLINHQFYGPNFRADFYNPTDPNLKISLLWNEEGAQETPEDKDSKSLKRKSEDTENNITNKKSKHDDKDEQSEPKPPGL